MLILGRKPGQRIVITTASGERITVLVVRSRGREVRIGIEASQRVKVMREELRDETDY